MRARPDLHFGGYKFPAYHITYQTASFNTYHVTGHADRDFHGIGPALSWSASTPFAGNSQDGEITFDWGANAALLFGKQRTRVRDMATGWSKAAAGNDNFPYVTLYQRPGGHSNDRSVTVPNLGASAGLSYRYADAKISIGYRFDVFLKAVDTGIDTSKTSNLTFNGPYASISIGLGD
jgi:iron complex outermembrane recepter protein